MNTRGAGIVAVHLSKLLDLAQLLLLALCQAGEDLAVAWVRAPGAQVGGGRGTAVSIPRL
jgi:hypothetical protein